MPLGKTGTCNDPTSRVGWFVTYADEAHPKIALAVLLRGSSRQVIGPTAALVAGRIYRRLREQNYFAARDQADVRHPDRNLLSSGK
jgi:beta-lactamase class D